jgi:hypothetical protein
LRPAEDPDHGRRARESLANARLAGNRSSKITLYSGAGAEPLAKPENAGAKPNRA